MPAGQPAPPSAPHSASSTASGLAAVPVTAAAGTTHGPLGRNIEVTIPRATQPGLVLRLAGKGLPAFGGAGRGDLYVRIDVHIPERLSEILRYVGQAYASFEERDRAEESWLQPARLGNIDTEAVREALEAVARAG